MSHYFDIDFVFDNPTLSLKPLEVLFTNSFFQPVAVGGKYFNNHFLAGYALEPFSRLVFGYSGTRTIGAIPTTLLNATAYVQLMADNLAKREQYNSDLSPFEREEQSAGVTFIESVRLEPDILPTLEKWFAPVKRGGCIYLYGTIAVAVKEPHNLAWERAFRFQSDIGLLPFIEIQVRMDGKRPNMMRLTIDSNSNIWLRDANDLNNQIGPSEADANLSRLADMASSLDQAIERNGMSKELPYLSAEGSEYRAEKDRLFQAFSEIKPYDQDFQ